MRTVISNIVSALILVTSFFGLCATASAQDHLPARDIGAFSWNATASDRVSGEKWEKPEIAAFIDRILDTDPVLSKVGDFVFADVDADGQLDLLTTVDYSGRAFFNTMVIVRRDSNSFSTQAIEVWNMASLKNRIRDLDADGQMELILTKRLTPYLGSQPHAVWDAVYKLANFKYIDRSADFSLFYQNEVLPRLKQKPPVTAGTARKDDNDVLQIEIVKILRVIGADRNAGLDLALAWSEDSKPVRRIFAASMLGDFDDQSAAETLQKLTLDSDVNVATNARSVISRKKATLK